MFVKVILSFVVAEISIKRKEWIILPFLIKCSSEIEFIFSNSISILNLFNQNFNKKVTWYSQKNINIVKGKKKNAAFAIGIIKNL